MSPFVFADNFLAGSILSLLLPACLVVVLAVWYVFAAGRVPTPPPTSPTLPPAEVVAAADGVDEITPAGPPPGEIV